jgi:23S rRNA maturation mini-RNase III
MTVAIRDKAVQDYIVAQVRERVGSQVLNRMWDELSDEEKVEVKRRKLLIQE